MYMSNGETKRGTECNKNASSLPYTSTIIVCLSVSVDFSNTATKGYKINVKERKAAKITVI